MSFGVCKFKNTSAMRVILFSKCGKLNLNLENGKKNQKIFFVSEIIASENFAINCI